jgi:hypothetical protein
MIEESTSITNAPNLKAEKVCIAHGQLQQCMFNIKQSDGRQPNATQTVAQNNDDAG